MWTEWETRTPMPTTKRQLAGALLTGGHITERDRLAAFIHDEATVKYYFPERDHIRLQPANGRMAPILVRAADLRATTILGVVCGIYRRI